MKGTTARVPWSGSPMPTGTVTFLFTDIEGSTLLWEQHPMAMQAAVARHDTLLREPIEQHGGYASCPRPLRRDPTRC